MYWQKGSISRIFKFRQGALFSFEFLLTANKVGKGNNRFSKGADALQRCSMGAEQEKQILYQRFNNDATMVQQSVHWMCSKSTALVQQIYWYLVPLYQIICNCNSDHETKTKLAINLLFYLLILCYWSPIHNLQSTPMVMGICVSSKNHLGWQVSIALSIVLGIASSIKV